MSSDELEMIAEECFDIAGDLLDPEYSIRAVDHESIIERAKYLYDTAQESGDGDTIEAAVVLVHQLLVRLLSESPHIYAITEGMFSGFEGFDKCLIHDGATDVEGFTWMIPKPYGPYMDWKYPKSK